VGNARGEDVPVGQQKAVRRDECAGAARHGDGGEAQVVEECRSDRELVLFFDDVSRELAEQPQTIVGTHGGGAEEKERCELHENYMICELWGQAFWPAAGLLPGVLIADNAPVSAAERVRLAALWWKRMFGQYLFTTFLLAALVSLNAQTQPALSD